MSTQEPYLDGTGAMRGLKAGLWIAGIATIGLGAVAMLFPFAASLAVELLVGGVLTALGLIQILRALFSGGVESRLWQFVFGGVALVTGGVLLRYPMEGLQALTLVIAGFFVIGGIAKLIGAWQVGRRWRRAAGLRPVRGWGWLALSGAVSLLLGIVLFAGLPIASTWALGLIVGVDLVFLGLSEIAFAMALRVADDS